MEPGRELGRPGRRHKSRAEEAGEAISKEFRLSREHRAHLELNLPLDRSPRLSTPVSLLVMLVAAVLLVGAYQRGWLDWAPRAFASIGLASFGPDPDEAVNVCKASLRRGLALPASETPGQFVPVQGGPTITTDQAVWHGWVNDGSTTRRFTCTYQASSGSATIVFGQ